MLYNSRNRLWIGAVTREIDWPMCTIYLFYTLLLIKYKPLKFFNKANNNSVACDSEGLMSCFRVLRVCFLWILLQQLISHLLYTWMSHFAKIILIISRLWGVCSWGVICCNVAVNFKWPKLSEILLYTWLNHA